MWRMFGARPSAAERRRKAAKAVARFRRRGPGKELSPVVVEGRAIAHTFWGRAWCENLERYSDFANRLPRGRTYVRSGLVVDLRVEPGRARAKVQGSALYETEVTIAAVPPARWAALRDDCAGGIDSLVELLAGRFSKGVMERVCRQGTGLFPAPAEIRFSCSCPDFASLCKHVAAALYGVGARLDEKPELLFRLRGVDEKDLIATGRDLSLTKRVPPAARLLKAEGLAELFGVELARADAESPAGMATKKGRHRGAPHAEPRRPTRRR